MSFVFECIFDGTMKLQLFKEKKKSVFTAQMEIGFHIIVKTQMLARSAASPKSVSMLQRHTTKSLLTTDPLHLTVPPPWH